MCVAGCLTFVFSFFLLTEIGLQMTIVFLYRLAARTVMARVVAVLDGS